MARRVEDLTLITPIISGPDFRDASCAPVPWADPAKVELKKLKVAFCADNGGIGRWATDDDTKNLVRQVAKWLEGATQSVTEDAPLAQFETLRETRNTLTNGDGWAFYKRLADKWGTVNFSPSRKEAMANAKPISSAAMVEAWEQHDEAKSRMLGWMKQYDVFICPTSNKVAQPIDAEGPTWPAGKDGGWPYTGVFNSSGWPSVVVRCGSSADGKLPIGLQVVAAPWREDICLAVASYLESRSGGWKKPPI